MYYAHSKNEQGQRHDLVEHLRSVAKLTEQFAANLGAAEAGRYLGLWHDLGKFNPAFQQYLMDCEQNPNQKKRGPDHKAAGTSLADQYAGLPMLTIHGHHGGLGKRKDVAQWLRNRMKEPDVALCLAVARQAMPDLEPAQPLPLPAFVERDARPAELFVRLLLSALVDADRLDTEAFGTPKNAAYRATDINLAELWARLDADQQRLMTSATGTVNAARRAIYQNCLDAAEQPPGLFRLAVPTGGGKTRSALAFALRHALRHDLQRVIVAVPFISITQQTAQVYREALGEEEDQTIVLEHHSATHAGEDDDDDFNPRQVWARLAAENWDAPVIVTTTVQLFESLFAHRTSRCRKLHRLARSVIILDEVQALPPHLLTPILDVLRELCAHYGATVVLSTATQPAFEVVPAFANLLAFDIVPEARHWFDTLRRVDYEWQTDSGLAWGDVADLIHNAPQSLTVVNTKRDALTLMDALNEGSGRDAPDTFHLSTLLCGAHRRRVINEVTTRLKAGQPCRLVSTQVIEAGVDLDFPLVLRALGPLDSIIQVAGRCNREGRLERGRVVVFRPADGSLPPGAAYKTGVGLTQTLRAEAILRGGDLDPDDPAIVARYFAKLFHTLDLDREGIQRLREQLLYPDVSQKFRMIDDNTLSVIVRYGSQQERDRVDDWVNQLRTGRSSPRRLLRLLQPYMVSLYTAQARRYQAERFISEILPGVGEWHGDYDAVRGLTARDAPLDQLVL